MGKIKNNLFFEDIKCSLVNLQKETLNQISTIFYDIELHDIKLNCTEGLGVRGKYENLMNNQLELYFEYASYTFEFYLSYDQLEFYISKNGKIIRKCNLEDFWEDKILIEKFINYLKKDLVKLKIPFNTVGP